MGSLEPITFSGPTLESLGLADTAVQPSELEEGLSGKADLEDLDAKLSIEDIGDSQDFIDGLTSQQWILPGCVLFYDFQNIINLFSNTAGTVQANLGDQVAFVSDQSPAHNDGVIPSATNRPIASRMGGNGAVQFDGSSDYIELPTFTLQDYTIVLFTRWNANLSVDGVVLAHDSSPVTPIQSIFFSNNFIWSRTDGVWVGTPGAGLKPWEPQVTIIRREGAWTRYYRNLELLREENVGSAPMVTSNFFLGIWENNGNKTLPAPISVAHLSVYSEAMSDADRISFTENLLGSISI